MTDNDLSEKSQRGKHKWKQVWKKSESIWLTSGIQKIGIRNPDDCNPEFKVPLRRKFVGLFWPNSVAEYRVVSIFTQKTEQETVHPNIF